jgi:uncharacterized protein YfaQ (DUF2300 family)
LVNRKPEVVTAVSVMAVAADTVEVPLVVKPGFDTTSFVALNALDPESKLATPLASVMAASIASFVVPFTSATNAPGIVPDASETVTTTDAACTSLGTAKSPKSPTTVIVPRAVLIRRVNIFPSKDFFNC